MRLVVSGRVQGVAYRWSCLNEAERLGLRGWVRNLPDGRVEVVAEGTDRPLGKLLVWCREGPPLARVLDIEEHHGPALGLPPGFEITYR